jgi:hypothetical protein
VDAQFASAWIYDERQVLAYVWSDNNEDFYVRHMTTDPTLRLSFEMSFNSRMDAERYFDEVKTASNGVRDNIEGIFDTLFEQEGKEYAQLPESLEYDDALPY